MRRLLLLAALAAAPAAVAQTTPSAPAATAVVSSDTLTARAARAEAFFFDGQTAELRALADSAFAAAMTDEMHQGFLMQLLNLGGATAAGDWTTQEVEGMAAYRRPYTVGGMNAALFVVFNGEGQIAGMLLRPEGS